MYSPTRRQFLVAAGAAELSGTASFAAAVNDRVRIALVGLGGRATAHLRCLLELSGDNVELAARALTGPALLSHVISSRVLPGSLRPPGR